MRAVHERVPPYLQLIFPLCFPAAAVLLLLLPPSSTHPLNPTSCPPNRRLFVTGLVSPCLMSSLPKADTLFVKYFIASPHRSRSASPSPHDTLTLRALVSTKEAGIIIGKGGKNVAELREQTGVKAGVSKVIQGVHERVLTVTGPVDGVSKVRCIFLLRVT